jgi:hypothetical protein
MKSYFEEAIHDFILLFDKLESIVEKPRLIERSGILQFRYLNKDIQTLCLIKSGRIISSLNAIIFLFEKGFVLEIGVLIRTIKECIADLSFLLENYPGKPFTKSQKQYIDEFYKEEFDDPSNPVETIRKHNRVNTNKIHSSYARNINELWKNIKDEKVKKKLKIITNPYNHQKATTSILQVFSGYVHFSYTQSMEIIGGSPPDYHLKGFNNTPKIQEWKDIIISHFYELYNHFRFLSYKFDFIKEFQFLGEKQKQFQLYTGYNP